MRLLSTVEDTFAITSRGVVVVPGIPNDGQHRVKVGDPIFVRVTDRPDFVTHLAGIEMLGRPIDISSAKEREFIPILLGANTTKDDVPIGAELWTN